MTCRETRSSTGSIASRSRSRRRRWRRCSIFPGGTAQVDALVERGDGDTGVGVVASEAEREAELLECYAYFKGLWDDRLSKPLNNDFIRRLAHSKDMRDMPPMEFLGNVILLIVGGNDTTRNSMSAGVYALNTFPAEYAKLKSNADLIPNMVSVAG